MSKILGTPHLSLGRLADRHVSQPDVGQVAEGDVEGVAEADHSAERRCGKAARLDLSQRLGGDAGCQGHLDEAAAGPRGPEGGSEALASCDLFGGEWWANHAGRISLRSILDLPWYKNTASREGGCRDRAQVRRGDRPDGGDRPV